MYLICCLGVLRLRAKGVSGTETPFIVPGGPTVPLLASLGILALLASLERTELWGLVPSWRCVRFRTGFGDSRSSDGVSSVGTVRECGVEQRLNRERSGAHEQWADVGEQLRVVALMTWPLLHASNCAAAASSVATKRP